MCVIFHLIFFFSALFIIFFFLFYIIIQKYTIFYGIFKPPRKIRLGANGDIMLERHSTN